MAAVPPEARNKRLVLGRMADGGDAFDYFWPPLLDFASRLAKAESVAGTSPTAHRWEDVLPLPAGIRLYRRLRDANGEMRVVGWEFELTLTGGFEKETAWAGSSTGAK